MTEIVDILKWLLQRSDPMLVACVLLLAYWQRQVSRKLADHLDPDNNNPHGACDRSKMSYDNLSEKLEDINIQSCRKLQAIHDETREEFQLVRQERQQDHLSLQNQIVQILTKGGK